MGKLARELAGIEPEDLEQFIDARANARALPAEQLRYGRDVLGHGPVWKQAMALNHIADFAPQERRGRRRGIAPVDAHDPARGLDELVDHAQQRRLAAA